MSLINTKDSISKFLFFLTLFVVGVVFNGYESVYCIPTLEAKIILGIVAVSALLSTFVKTQALQPLIFVGLGIGLGVNIYLILYWGQTLLYGILWIVPFFLLGLILWLFGVTTWVIILAWDTYWETGSIVLVGLVALVTPFILWQLEERKKIWVQRLMAIPFGIALVAQIPVLLTWDSITLYLKENRVNKTAYWVGFLCLAGLTTWHYLQYQDIASRIAKYNNGEDLTSIVTKENLSGEPLFEKLLGIHIKYHTRYCEYDGRRPPIHDPFLVFFLRTGTYPTVLANLRFAERVEQYRTYYGEYQEECNCAYWRDEGLYWESRSFQNALRSSLERN